MLTCARHCSKCFYRSHLNGIPVTALMQVTIIISSTERLSNLPKDTQPGSSRAQLYGTKVWALNHSPILPFGVWPSHSRVEDRETVREEQKKRRSIQGREMEGDRGQRERERWGEGDEREKKRGEKRIPLIPLAPSTTVPASGPLNGSLSLALFSLQEPYSSLPSLLQSLFSLPFIWDTSPEPSHYCIFSLGWLQSLFPVWPPPLLIRLWTL